MWALGGFGAARISSFPRSIFCRQWCVCVLVFAACSRPCASLWRVFSFCGFKGEVLKRSDELQVLIVICPFYCGLFFFLCAGLCFRRLLFLICAFTFSSADSSWARVDVEGKVADVRLWLKLRVLGQCRFCAWHVPSWERIVCGDLRWRVCLFLCFFLFILLIWNTRNPYGLLKEGVYNM